MRGVQETHINADRGHMIGTVIYPLSETVFGEDATVQDLYRETIKLGEHGRVTSKMYVDTPEGKTMHVGYVFEKRARYEDSGEYYKHETWISLGKHIPARPERLLYFEPEGGECPHCGQPLEEEAEEVSVRQG